MSQDDLTAYRQLYIQTAKEYIQKLKQGSDVLSAQPSDQEAIKNIYISSHSLKGQSMVMGYTKTAILSNLIENIFYGITHSSIHIEPSLLTSIKKSIDELDQSMQQIEKIGEERDLSQAIQALQTISGVAPTIPDGGKK